MLIEGRVKCLSPQNTSGVSGVHFVAAESNTIEVNGDSFFRHNKTEKTFACLHTAPVVLTWNKVIYTMFKAYVSEWVIFQWSIPLRVLFFLLQFNPWYQVAGEILFKKLLTASKHKIVSVLD